MIVIKVSKWDYANFTILNALTRFSIYDIEYIWKTLYLAFLPSFIWSDQIID